MGRTVKRLMKVIDKPRVYAVYVRFWFLRSWSDWLSHSCYIGFSWHYKVLRDEKTHTNVYHLLCNSLNIKLYIYMYICIYKYIYLYMYLNVYILIYCVYIYTHMFIYVYLYYMYVYMSILFYIIKDFQDIIKFLTM